MLFTGCWISSASLCIHVSLTSYRYDIDLSFRNRCRIYYFLQTDRIPAKSNIRYCTDVLSVNYYLNRDFYPELLKYQAESEAAYYMKENKIPADDVVFVGEMESIADVILHKPTKVIAIEDVTVQDISEKFVFTSPEGRAKINSLGLKYDIITEFEDFPVTRLTWKVHQ